MFYQVIRVYRKAGSWKNSVQYFHAADYETVDACLLAASARYHNILTADLADSEVDYNAGYIISNAGQMLKSDIYDRRTEE